MKMICRTLLVLVLVCTVPVSADPAIKKGPELGQVVTPEQAGSWDWNVYPDGEGLPVGRGTVAAGQLLFEQQCAFCHGIGGVGASADELAGGEASLKSEVPDKTIGTYWPYSTTLFDFIRRAMPMNAPFSLSPDQVYAVTAYLLYINGIIKEDQELNQENLAAVAMPNRNGFLQIYEFGEAQGK